MRARLAEVVHTGDTQMLSIALDVEPLSHSICNWGGQGAEGQVATQHATLGGV